MEFWRSQNFWKIKIFVQFLLNTRNFEYLAYFEAVRKFIETIFVPRNPNLGKKNILAKSLSRNFG